ncbi:MAG TPA: transposase [Chthonomonadaceae bacterium]|jgi:SRSO17 transposase|nr:transposase [Chthonomonadaceae bacterium]
MNASEFAHIYEAFCAFHAVFAPACGRALVDRRLYLPPAWAHEPLRCEQAGIPATERVYQTKPQIGLALLRRARAWGHLHACWVAGDDLYGQSPHLRDALAAEGLCLS